MNEDRMSHFRFSLAALVVDVVLIAMACGLGRQYDMHGVTVAFDAVVGFLALSQIFKTKQVFGVRIPTLSLLDHCVCVVIC